MGVKIFFGDPINVIKRCYFAAKKNNLDVIIRITEIVRLFLRKF